MENIIMWFHYIIGNASNSVYGIASTDSVLDICG